MGVQDGAPYCRSSRTLTHTLRQIRNSVKGEYPINGTSRPYVGVDVSGWIVAALKNKLAVQQVFMEEKVPVTQVVDYVRKRIDVLTKNGFTPLLVFDGSTNPAKKDTNSARSDASKDAKDEIDRMYADPNEKDINKLLKLQQKAVQVRTDILFEVLDLAKKARIPVVGSAFEADSQLVALGNQNIIDFALTNDGDIPYQGMEKTIMRLSVQNESGPCCLATRQKLQEKVKEAIEEAHQVDVARARKRGSREFDDEESMSVRDLSVEDLSLFACLLGNDYVDRLEQHGPQACLRTMYDYLKLESDFEKLEFVKNHVKRLPANGQRKNSFMPGNTSIMALHLLSVPRMTR